MIKKVFLVLSLIPTLSAYAQGASITEEDIQSIECNLINMAGTSFYSYDADSETLDLNEYEKVKEKITKSDDYSSLFE